MERAIEQIRVNASKSPPTPWSDYVNTVPIPDNPFIKRIHYVTVGADILAFKNGITKGIYILRHPCIILINIFRMYKALVEETNDSWDEIGNQLYYILDTYQQKINDDYDKMTFEKKVRNEETGRYTSYHFTRPLNNTSQRVSQLNMRRKAINMTRERHNVKANERIATLNMEFEWSAQPSTQVSIQSPPTISPVDGVYGALVGDIDFVQSFSEDEDYLR